jgi:hypothetical protein
MHSASSCHSFSFDTSTLNSYYVTAADATPMFVCLDLDKTLGQNAQMSKRYRASEFSPSPVVCIQSLSCSP